MEHFTPITSALGGALIGTAASLLWIANGRIAGISGILAGAIAGPASDKGWRLAFLAGLVAAPLLCAALLGAPRSHIGAGWPRLVAAGLLVGFGARLAGGCTSGHGVCGLARLSRRSIAATCVFMSAAMLTVYLSRHVLAGVAP